MIPGLFLNIFCYNRTCVRQRSSNHMLLSIHIFRNSYNYINVKWRSFFIGTIMSNHHLNQFTTFFYSFVVSVKIIFLFFCPCCVLSVTLIRLKRLFIITIAAKTLPLSQIKEICSFYSNNIIRVLQTVEQKVWNFLVEKFNKSLWHMPSSDTDVARFAGQLFKY